MVLGWIVGPDGWGACGGSPVGQERRLLIGGRIGEAACVSC
jgi:hypothetical protein